MAVKPSAAAESLEDLCRTICRQCKSSRKQDDLNYRKCKHMVFLKGIKTCWMHGNWIGCGADEVRDYMLNHGMLPNAKLSDRQCCNDDTTSGAGDCP